VPKSPPLKRTQPGHKRPMYALPRDNRACQRDRVWPSGIYWNAPGYELGEPSFNLQPAEPAVAQIRLPFDLGPGFLRPATARWPAFRATGEALLVPR
jgi:hypothetical protein